MKSASAQLLNIVIASGAKSFLRGEGFRKRANSFQRKDGELFSVINFQSSQWNSDRSCRFTVNLNKILPFYHEKWTGQSFPENSASAVPICSYRIGLLMPENKDLWWEVRPDSEFTEMAADVVAKIRDYGLPFLAQASDLDWIAKRMLADTYYPGSSANQTLAGAIILAYQGKTEEASEVIDLLRRKNKVAGFAETISTIERRLTNKST